MNNRFKPEVRREQILQAAMLLASQHWYNTLTRSMVADAAQCSEATVSHYFGTMNQLRKYIMRHAVKNGLLKIIGQGVVHNDPIALRVSEEIQKQAVNSLVKK